MCLSARRTRRSILDYAASCLGDRNHDVAVRQWAAVLLGKAGDASDHRLVTSDHSMTSFLPVRLLSHTPTSLLAFLSSSRW
jgi:hypothetical protein